MNQTQESYKHICSIYRMRCLNVTASITKYQMSASIQSFFFLKILFSGHIVVVICNSFSIWWWTDWCWSFRDFSMWMLKRLQRAAIPHWCYEQKNKCILYVRTDYICVKMEMQSELQSASDAHRADLFWAKQKYWLPFRFTLRNR